MGEGRGEMTLFLIFPGNFGASCPGRGGGRKPLKERKDLGKEKTGKL